MMEFIVGVNLWGARLLIDNEAYHHIVPEGRLSRNRRHVMSRTKVYFFKKRRELASLREEGFQDK